jgi:hypothetical protein
VGLLFDKINKVMTVEDTDDEITIQNLLNAIRQWEDELSSMDIGSVASAVGKEPLGDGVLVGITLTLLNNWRLAFEARGGSSYIQCKVSGGNLVGTHPDGVIYPTAFTQVVMAASSSATLLTESSTVWEAFTVDHTTSGTYGKLVSDIKSGTDDIEIYMIRALGLAQENYYLDQTNYTTYQGIKLLTSGRLRTYSVSGSVGTDSDVIATYNIVSSWTGDELNTYKVTKV